jgi:hypothetical protein
MFQQHRKLHGNDGADDICWFAPSRVMNPKLPQSVIDCAIANDAARARAEYENIWREDVSDFVTLDVIEACTDWGVIERPPQRGVLYTAYHDAAGGTGRDSFTLAIGHAEHSTAGRVVIDLVRERKPRFVAEDVVREYADVLRNYGVRRVIGDGYAGGLTSDIWERNFITFQKCDNSTADNYLAALPLLTSRRARLVDVATLRTQLSSLERKVVSGHEVVTHPSTASAHDDVATSVCGCLVAAAEQQSNSAWMLNGNLRPVIAQLQAMGPYRRKLNTGEPNFVAAVMNPKPGNLLANVLIAALLVAAVYFGREVLLPIALAVLLSFVLAPPVRLLQRLNLPRFASVTIVVS